MSSGAPPSQQNPARKRRAHKRSRNGCMTCKQRHIRCDELKPVCAVFVDTIAQPYRLLYIRSRQVGMGESRPDSGWLGMQAITQPKQALCFYLCSSLQRKGMPSKSR
ncbi:hypothetical protein B0H66DRAFT_184518 [Apodospora peruviana]|uniref:Zn(2)-C6 fungal-type domain-containing protein n=1 Tax=Apodospora peruviana TaxID=516989 RepID=A0AAE0M7A6_9PEZI|nr:hypothetical protein B0H66DRAFT_184518 [Apodospora peruviana]